MKGSAKKILCKRLRENVENPLACGAAADWIEVQHVLLGDKDAEIERLQGGIGYLLERSGHKPCTRLDLSNIAGRILAGEDVYSYRLEAKQDV